MERKNISSGTHWEGVMGYSRAVRAGDMVFVSGTTATDANGNIVGDDYAAQTRFVIEKIEQALMEAGASLKDVVRTRVFVVDATQWEQVAAVHGEFFGGVRPANTLVEISALVSTGYLVEIEVDAIIGAGDAL
jgi:enamine deaminase RidA (YjgF/YER057c/UK114 family)